MEWNWQKFYEKAYDWILSYGPKIIIAILVLIAGLWVIRVFGKWLRKGLERKRFNPSLRYFLQNLIVIALQIFLLIMTLQIAGLQLTFFTAIIAGLSVAAGLALSGTLQNFVSGILILFLRPYSVGDNVVMQGQEGTVTTIQLFHTIILTFDNKTIIVPNGQLANNVVINLSREGKRRMDIDLKFNYSADLERVKKIMMDCAASMDFILKDPALRIGVIGMEYDRFSISLQAWVASHGFEDNKMKLQERLLTELKTAGVVTPAK